MNPGNRAKKKNPDIKSLRLFPNIRYYHLLIKIYVTGEKIFQQCLPEIRFSLCGIEVKSNNYSKGYTK